MKTGKTFKLATISLVLGLSMYLQGCPAAISTPAAASPSPVAVAPV